MLTGLKTAVTLILVGALLLTHPSSSVLAGSQRPSLDEARTLLDQYRVSESCEAFAAHGTDAVEYIIALIRLNTYHGAQAQFLEGFLVKIPGRSVDAALIQLLEDPSAKIRGLIAAVLGARGTRDAVPALINCLSDLQETDLMLVRNHVDPNTIPVLVRDQAISALERITDHSLRPSGTDEERAAAWRSWWVTNATKWMRGLPD